MLGWRTVPTNDGTLGATARSVEPVVRQIFIGRSDQIADDMAFERKLYVIRQLAEHAIRQSELPGREHFYIPSLSYKTIVYKGMLTAQQLEEFYPDLADPAMDTALALIHSRFSTNTFPSWARSQPFRYMLHNGEINTIRGNLNWMNARQKMLDLGAVRRRSAQAAAHHRPRRQRLGHVRQCAGAAGPGRPLAGPRGHDDDPRAVGARSRR